MLVPLNIKYLESYKKLNELVTKHNKKSGGYLELARDEGNLPCN